MLERVILTGKIVRLEPLSEKHADDLETTTGDPETWRYHGVGNLVERSALDAYIQAMQEEPPKGIGITFAIIRLDTERAVGSTSLCDISLQHCRAEIGRTWLAPETRRTGVNTEAKLLLLQHAFETLKMLRVQLKTDTRNVVSARAIERLGAKYEGVLRSHMILHNGSRRDTVYYSILADEWEAVKERLMDALTAVR